MTSSADTKPLILELFERRYKASLRLEGPRKTHGFHLLFGNIAIELTGLFEDFNRRLQELLEQNAENADAQKSQRLMTAVIADWIAQIVADSQPDMVVQFSTGIAPKDPAGFQRLRERGEVESPLDLPTGARHLLALCVVENKYSDMNFTRIEEIEVEDDQRVLGFRLLDEIYGQPNHQGAFADLYTPQSPLRPHTRFDVGEEARKNARAITKLLEETPRAESEGLQCVTLSPEKSAPP